MRNGKAWAHAAGAALWLNVAGLAAPAAPPRNIDWAVFGGSAAQSRYVDYAGLWLAEELTDTFQLLTGNGGTVVLVSSRIV